MIQKLKEILEKLHNFLVKEEEFLKVEEHLLKDAIEKYRKEISFFLFKKWFIPHPVNNQQPHITHHHTLAVFIVAIFTFKVLVVSLFIPLDYSYAGGISSADLVFSTNQARAENHLSQLMVSDELIRAARLKAEDMFEHTYWSHNSPLGTPPWHWFDEVGYVYEHAGENLAMDFYSSDGVFTGWKNSRSHWENIMNPNFREIGIAVVPGVFDGKNTTIVVQMFGTRPGSKIPPTKLINSEQGTENEQINNEERMKDTKKPEKTLTVPEIISPKENAVLKKPNPVIMGKADSQVLVTVLDDKFNLGQVPTDDYGYYSYRAPELLDGKHNFKSFSSLDEKKSDYSDPVEVIIDTKAPKIMVDSLEIDYQKNEGADVFKIKIDIQDGAISAKAVSKNKQVDLVLSSGGSFKGILKFEEAEVKDKYSVTLYATDRALNSAVLDIELTPEKENSSKVLGESTDKTNEKIKKLKNENIAILEENNSISKSANNIQVLEPKAEKKLAEEISLWAKYGKAFTLILGFILFFAYLLQAYVIYHKGLMEGKAHPIFHAIGVLCIMVLILMN